MVVIIYNFNFEIYYSNILNRVLLIRRSNQVPADVVTLDVLFSSSFTIILFII